MPPSDPSASKSFATARRAALRVNLTPAKGIALGVVILGAVIAAWNLYPSFPRVPGALEPGAASDAAGKAILDEMLRAHGGLETFRAIQSFELEVDDTWSRLFASFSIWRGHPGHIQALIVPNQPAYKARLSFEDNALWGYDGTRSWVVEDGLGQKDSPNSTRARFASALLPRLLLLPFSIALEGAEVRALQRAGGDGTQDILDVRFPSPSGHAGQKDRWLLFVDGKSHHVLRMVFAQSAADPPYIESCFVDGRKRVGPVELSNALSCSMATRLTWDLHSLGVARSRILESVPDEAFLPPGTATATVARRRSVGG